MNIKKLACTSVFSVAVMCMSTPAFAADNAFGVPSFFPGISIPIPECSWTGCTFTNATFLQNLQSVRNQLIGLKMQLQNFNKLGSTGDLNARMPDYLGTGFFARAQGRIFSTPEDGTSGLGVAGMILDESLKDSINNRAMGDLISNSNGTLSAQQATGQAIVANTNAVQKQTLLMATQRREQQVQIQKGYSRAQRFASGFFDANSWGL